MLNKMRRFLVFLILFLAGPLLALAQAPLSTTPSVTPPYDVNATIPGEGYQGFPGPYGGQKILQYCYFNRFLGEPKAGLTMYMEFKACAPKKTHLEGEITWGDGTKQTVSDITCGRWRIPHIYKELGTYSANICVEGECCKGEPPPQCAPQAPECVIWPTVNGQCPRGTQNKFSDCAAVNFTPCPDESAVKRCDWVLNGKIVSTKEPCWLDLSEISGTLNATDKLEGVFYREDGSQVKSSCQRVSAQPDWDFSSNVAIDSPSNNNLPQGLNEAPPLGPLNNKINEAPPIGPLNNFGALAVGFFIGWPGWLLGLLILAGVLVYRYLLIRRS